MARLESVLFTPHRSVLKDGQVLWSLVNNSKIINGLPQIFWSNGLPWREANLWFLEGACSQHVDLKTIQSKAISLLAYAKWLEKTETDWWDFPPRKENRCLVRYRGALVSARNSSELAPSTVSQRMRVVVSFYRWLRAVGLISTVWPMWHERTVGIHLTDTFGFERTLTVNTTDLAIQNRAAPGERLEDGLLPVSSIDRNRILEFAKKQASQELFWLLTIGFYTGMRLQTITDLKIKTLENAVPDPADINLYQLSVGPGATPPVATKFGVTGKIWIPKNLLDNLLYYAYSNRRLKRETKAAKINKDLVFLTRFGNPYAQRGSDKSVAINVELHEFRKRAKANNLPVMREFRFHQTRCTYATELARLAISAGGAIHAVALVKEALLHKHEATALKYIKFVEKSPIKAELANTFTRNFLGLITEREQISNA